MGLTSRQRSLRASIAAYGQHAKHDPVETTSRARETFLSRFMAEVDPDGSLRRERPQEATRRAAAARAMYFKQLAFRSAKARAARRG